MPVLASPVLVFAVAGAGAAAYPAAARRRPRARLAWRRRALCTIGSIAFEITLSGIDSEE
jgi:hypothetical protein